MIKKMAATKAAKNHPRVRADFKAALVRYVFKAGASLLLWVGALACIFIFSATYSPALSPEQIVQALEDWRVLLGQFVAGAILIAFVYFFARIYGPLAGWVEALVSELAQILITFGVFVIVAHPMASVFEQKLRFWQWQSFLLALGLLALSFLLLYPAIDRQVDQKGNVDPDR